MLCLCDLLPCDLCSCHALPSIHCTVFVRLHKDIEILRYIIIRSRPVRPAFANSELKRTVQNGPLCRFVQAGYPVYNHSMIHAAN